MSNGIVFVLHGGAEEQYATALAGALAPLAAFPSPLTADGADRTRFGLGAVCVIVWSRDLNAAMAGADVLEMLPKGAANGVVCRVGDAPLPTEFAGAQLVIVEGGGDAVVDAELVRDAITNILRRRAERSEGRGRRAVSPDFSPDPAARRGGGAGRRHMAVRSAYGLVATLAAAGVVAHSIGQRADATGAEPSDVGAAPSEPEEEAAAVAVDRSAARAAEMAAEWRPAPAPLIDQWLTAPAPTGAVALEQAAPEIEAAPTEAAPRIDPALVHAETAAADATEASPSEAVVATPALEALASMKGDEAVPLAAPTTRSPPPKGEVGVALTGVAAAKPGGA
jgi:hypothetical protein